MQTKATMPQPAVEKTVEISTTPAEVWRMLTGVPLYILKKPLEK